MPCPECQSVILTLVSSDKEYIEEPFEFNEGDFVHKHDSNPRVSTWSCQNGHQFQLKGKTSCSGCLLEQLEATRLAQEAAGNSSRMRSYGGGGNDHPVSNFFSSGGPGPAIS